jgi:hypothetical protein
MSISGVTGNINSACSSGRVISNIDSLVGKSRVISHVNPIIRFGSVLAHVNPFVGLSGIVHDVNPHGFGLFNYLNANHLRGLGKTSAKKNEFFETDGQFLFVIMEVGIKKAAIE